ncbi:hypothetical protein Tco_0952350 [Tanacetum coccineum]|uniref:Uncharacterized protein n=1 Tax=Tanacetum coccineum TaxID=301880 RepID=A0ABQ5DWU6_9ASTR
MVSSHPVFSPLTGCDRLVSEPRMSTLVFVDPESSTQADGAQSSRVPVPLPEDPYEAIRQAYLDGTDTETTRMAIRVPRAMSSGLSAGMAEVAAMFESAFRKRFRSSYESSPSVSPPDLPSQKHYHGTSKLVEDSEEDEEIEESMDSDSVSEDAEDEGPTAEDEDPAAEDEGLTAGVEGPGMDDEGYGLDDESRGIDNEGHSVESDGLGLEEEEEAVPRGQQQATLVVGTTMSAPLGLGYGALRCHELALEEGDVYSMFEVGQGSGSAPESERPERTPPSSEWTSGSLPISPSPSDDPSPMIPLMVPSHVATPAAVEIEGILTELGAQRYDRDIGELFTRSGAVREEIFSQRYRFRSLEYEQERVAVTFRAIWRPVLALEAWAGQTDAQRAALWHAISDVQGENRDLRLQLAEERRARLELAEVVDGMRRGQEPRGGA